MKTVNVIEAVFFAALDKKDAGERAAYLDQACNGDPDLRRCVEKLLNAQPKVGEFLQAPAVGLPQAVDHPVDERPGTVLGPYKLLHEIGEGGMGTVWMAEQEQPVRRRVALKVIKPGMDSKQVLARFEAERQALALMDHPNIAKVLDAGATDAGRPYFVMELVKGQPITEFCDNNRLPTRERLDLFVSVCHAIQHAHQKGIIHRDIKPSNVLVALYDGKPVPKVIDFGLAKAMVEPLTTKTLFTRHGQVVGTFEYMSPEQATLDQIDIDTRSDVYSLGVLLYELLTGTTPLDKDRLRRGGLAEVLRLIREEEPPKPSTRLTSTPGLLATAAAYRNSDSQKLSKTVRGELDWIVMKALDKDRNRRFASSSELAMDVGRYLRDEPVQACPPTLGYRLRKYARKHKVAFATGTAVAAALVVGLALASWQAVRATRAAMAAKRDRDAAIAAGKEVEDERDKTRKAFERLTTLTAARRADQYAADMATLPITWEAGNVAETRAMLDRHRPAGDERDLRNFEWHFWDRQTHAERVSERLPGVPDLTQSGPFQFPGPGLTGMWNFCDDGSRLGGVFVTTPGGKSERTREPRVVVWDAATRKVLLSHAIAVDAEVNLVGSARNLSFSRGGKRVAFTFTLAELRTGPDSGRPRLVKPVRQVVDVDSKKVLYDSATVESSPASFAIATRGTLILSPDGRYCVRNSPSRTQAELKETVGKFTVLDLDAGGKEVVTVEETVFDGFSRDGSRVIGLTGRGADARPKVWDTATGKELLAIDTRTALTFTPDGSRLVGVTNTNAPVGTRQVLKVFDAASGRELSEVPLPENRVQARSDTGQTIANQFVVSTFNHDGSRLTLRRLMTSQVGERRFELIVIDMTESRILSVLDEQGTTLGPVSDVIGGGGLGRGLIQMRSFFTPDGKKYIAREKDSENSLVVLDTANGTVLQTLRGHAGRIAAYALSADGRWLRSVEQDGTFKEWDLDPPEPVRLGGGGQAAMSFDTDAVVSADGAFVAALGPRGAEPRVVRVWDSAGRGVKEFAPRTQPPVEGYFTSDGTIVLSRDGSRVALVRSARVPRLQGQMAGGLAIDPKKPDLPGDITVWDTAGGKELFYFEGHFTAFALSPDGHSFAISRGGRALRRDPASPDRNEPRPLVVFDVESGRETHSIPDAPYVFLLFFSPDGTRLAGITTQPARPFDGPQRDSSLTVFNLAVWTVADGRMLFHVDTGISGYLPNFVWSPDGTRLLLASGGGPQAPRGRFGQGLVTTRFTVLNAANGQVELTVNPAERGGFSAERPVFSPDGRRIACGVLTRQGQAVKLWDAATGQELLALHIPRGRERVGPSSHWSVAFSADGHRLLDFYGTERFERAPDGNGSRSVGGQLQVTTFDATPRPEATRAVKPTEPSGER